MNNSQSQAKPRIIQNSKFLISNSNGGCQPICWQGFNKNLYPQGNTKDITLCFSLLEQVF